MLACAGCFIFLRRLFRILLVVEEARLPAPRLSLRKPAEDFSVGPHYSAAKAGMLGLAKDLARELGPKNIRVNAVAPGMVATDIRGDKMSQEIMDRIVAGIPMGRIATPIEIANAFLFLASDLSSFVTGATIDVNGGMYIRA